MQQLQRFGAGDQVQADVFMFGGQATDAGSEIRSVHPATEQGNAFGGAAGADQIVADGKQLQQLAAGFLLGFAPRHFLGGFGGVVHDAGDDLQQPRAAGKLQRADPELLQQNHSISIRVEQQDRNRVAALQTFAGDFRAPAAGEQFMAQAILFHAKKTAIAKDLVEDGKLMIHGRFRADGKNGPACRRRSAGRW